MYTKFDQEIYSLLACPISKAELKFDNSFAMSKNLNLKYPKKKTGKEDIYDFRIHKPDYCIPSNSATWKKMQDDFETHHTQRIEEDNYEVYAEEIRGDTEIYTKEFHLTGKVLDVGGYHGLIRQFLKEREIDVYISVDPFINIFFRNK